MKAENSKIYILLTNTGTLFTRAIGVFTRAPYNHSSLAFDPELQEIYSFGRLKPRNPFLGGFVRESRNLGLYALRQDTRCAVYELVVTTEQLRNLRGAIAEFQREKDKYTYSLLGLLGVAFDRPVNRRHAYFCSQFVATVLHRGGVHLFDKAPGLVTPEDFQKCDRLKLVYEAKLNEYHYEGAASSN